MGTEKPTPGTNDIVPKGVDTSPKWVKEQIRNGLNIQQEDIKSAINDLSVEALLTFFEKNQGTNYSKKDRNVPENSAAHIIAYQKALIHLGMPIVADGMYGEETRSALIKFQKDNKLKGKNGIPGPETAKKIIELLSGIKGKTPEATLSVKPEEDTNEAVQDIVKKAKMPSMISRMSSTESFYSGSSPSLIDYAVVRQAKDGEYYVFDKPSNGVRTVYRTNPYMEIIGSAQVNEEGVITPLQGSPLVKVPYMPTPIILTK